MLSGGALRGTVVVAALLTSCLVSPSEQAPAGAPSAEVPTRYWLRNAELLDGPRGKVVRRVVGPVEVELSRDGRVYSLPDAKDRFEGYLRKEVLSRPQRDRGLALFIQREGELRLARSDGPVVGKIHAGAMVSVQAGEGEHLAIGGLQWGDWLGFVERDALGMKVGNESSPGPSGPGQSLVPPHPLELSSRRGDGEPQVEFARCRPIWFPAEGDPSQRIDGIELVGRLDVDPKLSPPRHHESTSVCKANVVVRHDERLFRVHSDGRESEVVSIPREFKAVAPPKGSPLLGAIAKNRSVFWLVYEPPSEVRCAEARFDDAERRNRNYLIGVVARLQELQGERRAYDATFVHHAGSKPGRPLPRTLRLEPRGQGGWGFDAEYVVLAADGDALMMAGLPVREATVAFDPSEAERWFLSRDACEAARDQALRTLKRDPRSMTSLGFHVEIPRQP